MPGEDLTDLDKKELRELADDLRRSARRAWIALLSCVTAVTVVVLPFRLGWVLLMMTSPALLAIALIVGWSGWRDFNLARTLLRDVSNGKTLTVAGTVSWRFDNLRGKKYITIKPKEGSAITLPSHLLFVLSFSEATGHAPHENTWISLDYLPLSKRIVRWRAKVKDYYDGE